MKRSQQAQSCHIKHTTLVWICYAQWAAPSCALAEMPRKDNQANPTSCCPYFTWISASNQHSTAPPGQHLIAWKGNSGSTRAALPSVTGHQYWKNQHLAIQITSRVTFHGSALLPACIPPLWGPSSLTLGRRASSRLICFSLFGVGLFHC